MQQEKLLAISLWQSVWTSTSRAVTERFSRVARVERKRWHVIDGGTRVEVTEFQGFVIFLKFSTSFSLGNGGVFLQTLLCCYLASTLLGFGIAEVKKYFII